MAARRGLNVVDDGANKNAALGFTAGVHRAGTTELALHHHEAGSTSGVGMSRSAVIRDFCCSADIRCIRSSIGAILWLISRPARWHALAQITFGGLRSVTGLEWFAFVILPVAVVALGGLACGMALRLRLEEDRPRQKISGRAGRSGWWR
jgi:hypothetical protein